jgi:hypothetical protein
VTDDPQDWRDPDGTQRDRGTTALPDGTPNPFKHMKPNPDDPTGDDLTNVLGPANPGDRTLEAHAEAGMRHAPLTAEVQVPLESFFGELVKVIRTDPKTGKKFKSTKPPGFQPWWDAKHPPKPEPKECPESGPKPEPSKAVPVRLIPGINCELW